LASNEYAPPQAGFPARNPATINLGPPGLSAEQLKHLSDPERSASAEVKLRLKGIAYSKSQGG
jgi:hypothetical protein